MELPKEVRDIVEEAVKKYPDDITKSVEWAENAIRDMPTFKSLIKALVHNAIMEMVYDVRHSSNVQTKRDTGYYGGKASTVVGKSSSVSKVYNSVYDYYIAGITLGNVVGKDIPDLASKEREIGNGHLFNSELLEWLGREGVTGDKTVREVVPEKRLRLNFDKLYKKHVRRAG